MLPKTNKIANLIVIFCERDINLNRQIAFATLLQPMNSTGLTMRSGIKRRFRAI